MVNVNAGRMNGEGPAEMPEDIQFPLQSVEEVQHFEEWLREPANFSPRDVRDQLSKYSIHTKRNLLWTEYSSMGFRTTTF